MATDEGRSRRRGEGRVFQRGSRWWIAFYGPGPGGRAVEYREPGGLTEKNATKRLKNRLNEVMNHSKGIASFTGRTQERVTVEDLLQRLEREYERQGKKSLPQLHAHLKHIRAFFGMDRALGISEERLRDYIDHRRAQTVTRKAEDGGEVKVPVAAATINRELEGLQRALNLGVELKMLNKSVVPTFPSLPEDNAREGFFERADFEAILTHLSDDDVKDFLSWFYGTGMRPGEIRSLTWAAFDKETWAIRLPARSAKTRKGRMLALEGNLRTIIQRRVAARRLDCPLIFHRKGKPVGCFKKRWKAACKAAGLAGYIPYDLRRTAVRNMIRADVDPAVAMRISGHRTRSVFDRYDIIDEDDIRDAVLKTEAYVAALPTSSKVASIAAAAN